MILLIDVSSKKFVITKRAEPRWDNKTQGQRLDNVTGLPQWWVEMVCTDASGGDVIKVTVTSEKAPEFAVGDQVRPVGLVAKHWCGKTHSYVGYKAERIELDT